MTSLKVDGRLASRFNLSTELVYRHTTGVFVNDPPLEWVIAASVLSCSERNAWVVFVASSTMLIKKLFPPLSSNHP